LVEFLQCTFFIDVVETVIGEDIGSSKDLESFNVVKAVYAKGTVMKDYYSHGGFIDAINQQLIESLPMFRVDRCVILLF
jgi:hypothetical protein